ncbi:YbhB/YbcL family Raf kinase inhibitor-like protein [Verticiella sediminum]|uniref:YbhB/YbcL family Raf kinase inhibitor-like protein n=1 Tax=Verticiella sediminum TaxID=1247510 RepID=A0A556AJL7_9BURK|nr:YbhB/YbcL family Raf kinase inhibitor-like protein [Verticiella sediminum]TSH93092.1 YbhB/YbcL family Raf kinase inhibitor-like protein [Verticiella sediminum]
MRVWSQSFTDGQPIPPRYAFCKIDAKTRVAMADNLNPHLAWSDLPEGTKSIAVICHDPDVPSKPDDVNQEGREIPSDLPRVEFFHWVLVDLSPEHDDIDEAAFSSGVTPHGKGGPVAPMQARQGINDYTGWFANDRDMQGEYFGYDGPCPPWNDSIVHRYVFTVYALDVETLGVDGTFTGADVRAAMEGHVLGQASLTGVYTLNPRLAPMRIGATSA